MKTKTHTEDCMDANDDTSVLKGECICPKRSAKEIAKDNDLFRSTLIQSPRHRFLITSGVSELQGREPQIFQKVITALREFKVFTNDNDPRGEHDFGKIDVDGYEFFWKFDYYSSDWETGADPYRGKTNLCLTLMLTEEY